MRIRIKLELDDHFVMEYGYLLTDVEFEEFIARPNYNLLQLAKLRVQPYMVADIERQEARRATFIEHLTTMFAMALTNALDKEAAKRYSQSVETHLNDGETHNDR